MSQDSQNECLEGAQGLGQDLGQEKSQLESCMLSA